MAIKRRTQANDWALPNPYINDAPAPIVTNRAPTGADRAEAGTLWVDVPAATAYVNAGTVAGTTTWTTNPSGALAVASMTVSPGDLIVDTGDLTVAGASTLTGAVATGALTVVGATDITGAFSVTGNTILTGDLQVTGDTTYTGDFDVTDTASIGLNSTNNAAGAITLTANGGVNETILIQSAQGTGAGAITLDGVAGGLTLQSALASADAININASNAAGGVDIDYGTGGFIVTGANGAATIATGTGAINVSADAAATVVNVATGGAAKTLTIGSANGASSTAINSGTGDITLTSTDAIVLAATGVATIDGTGVSIDGTLASNFTVTGAADLTLSSTLGSVVVNAEQAVNDAIQLTSVAGGLTANVGLVCDIDAAGAVTIDSSAAGVSIDGVLASNFTVTGAAADLSLIATGGSINITATEAAADALVVNCSNAASGATFDAGTGGIAIRAANGIVTLSSGTAATNISADAAATAVNVGTGAGVKTCIFGSTNTTSPTTLQAGSGALTLTAGGIFDVNAVGAVTVDGTSVSLDGTLASNLTVTGAGEDLTLRSAGGSVAISSTEAVATAITINASDAAAGIVVTTGTNGLSLDATAGVIDINSTTGLVTMTPAVDTQAATTVTINANVGVGTFTGLTTAAAAEEELTVNNTVCTATSAILCSVSNLGANDAQMTITRIVPAVNSFTVTCQNLGAGALNGNIILTFWLIS